MITKDDLIYDGKNIIIPAHWIHHLAILASGYDPIAEEDTKEDAQDYQTLREFFFDIEQKMANSGN